MRADRLLTILMLLQTREQITAGTLAERLEVSERTIHRDMDMLSSAGIPVYAERGPTGGFRLLNGYRTSLTGLTDDQIRVLPLLDQPGPLADIGLDRDVGQLVLKMLASLPDQRQRDVARARQRLHIDSAAWFRIDEPTPTLTIVQEAVWNDQKIALSYRHRGGDQFEGVVDPYGLVAKAMVWYLVARAGESIRVFRVARIEEIVILDRPAERPAQFDLAEFWADWVRDWEADLPRYPVTLVCEAEALPHLRNVLGTGAIPLDPIRSSGDPDGRTTITLIYPSREEAAHNLLRLGHRVEVTEPHELRETIARLASTIVDLYRDENTKGDDK